MLYTIALLIGITMLPFLELRASIPYGILQTELHWVAVFVVCIIANILIAPLLWVFVNNIMHHFLKIKVIDRVYQRLVMRTQRRVHPYVERYGTLGLALFIGVPLPGSGVYSGALGAYLLGFHYKDFLKAAIVGVLIAGIAVTAVVLTGMQGLELFVKVI